MRFMSLYKPGRESDTPPSEQVIAALGQLIEDMAKAGVLIATDGLQPSSKGARVRIDNGKLTVTDGPFAETKELIGGYAILNAKSKEEAIELTKRFLSLMGEGECEVRLMQDVPGFEAEHSQPAGVAARR
ncbi:MAG TPA: YciI family protein [Thermoanaerobaculia bacterium]